MFGFGISFPELYQRAGLARVDARFLLQLAASDGSLADRLGQARATPLSLKDESALLLELAPHLDDFVARLFGIQAELGALKAQHDALAPLFTVKRQFVQRKAAKAEASTQSREELLAALANLPSPTDVAAFELSFATQVAQWLGDEAVHAAQLEAALRYAAWALHTAEGKHAHQSGVLFKLPKKIDSLTLIDHLIDRHNGAATSFTIKPEHIRRRVGFKLTDHGTDLTGALDQANYCIWCHHQGKDSCSRGLKEKPAADGSIGFKKTAFGVKQAGCPLEEKISEFHEAKVAGHVIGALAIITIDNPMAAATGHRICNDCMKSCIYQKQEPVDIPQAETRTLKDVLELPYGFEIYSLLTRWNPLNLHRWLPEEPSGKRVLVAGMGPAGFGLAHNLLNDGHTVVGIDGLKIEPLLPALSGVNPDGSRTEFAPIKDYREIQEELDERVLAGFGGVAEYGITVRWDKNFLKVIRLLLERRAEFALIGGVRFGGTVSVPQAWDLGFDHIALCMGAGKPTVLDIPNALARGVRTASDFLMALQLTGAAKADSIANMQVRLPIVVVGGGLTAIDTATESLAYYRVQVEKFLTRAEGSGLDDFLCGLQGAERVIADEFITHARAIRGELKAAAEEARPERVLELLQTWGGATLAYRKRLIDSPAYTLNHEEVELALQEGIRFAENLNPLRIETDASGAACAFVFDSGGGDEVKLLARAIFVAAGTQPNTVLAREDATTFTLDGKYFAAIDEQGAPVKPATALSKPEAAHVLLQLDEEARSISFFGDLHPSYFGNVVKALGSAKQGYPVVTRMLGKRASSSEATDVFLARINVEWRATVHAVNRLTPTIVEVVVRAPAAARNFAPGQFYRLQNFEALAQATHGTSSTSLVMEGLALTGASTDKAAGLLSTIVLEMGGSSNLCAKLAVGEPVVLMGPTGAPTHIVGDQTVVLVGGGLGNAVLFSIGAAFRAAGSKVLYFAGYKKIIDRYKVAEIERAADVVVWCCDEAPGFTPTRAQDKTFTGNIVAAMAAYADGSLGAGALELAAGNRIIAIGSDRMMAAVAAARHGVLKPYLNPSHCALGSINSPMQCMMKELCAQCLQPHKLPDGSTTYVFSCFNQDQELDRVDFAGLNERLKQNSVQEKLTARWISHVTA